MLVFLDIDGVLRRHGSEQYRFQPDLLTTFEETLSLLPEAAIVIASSWREAFGIGEIREHFSDDVRRRVIGCTPCDSRIDGHRRHREVKSYLAKHVRPDRPWVAVDDDPENYPRLDNVIIVDGRRGFDRVAAGRLFLAAGLGPFRLPEDVSPSASPEPAAVLSEQESLDLHLRAVPPPLDTAFRALWDYDGPLPGPVAAPEGRWRTTEEQEALFRTWWRGK